MYHGAVTTFYAAIVLALAASNLEPRPRIVALGDSLTSGYGIGESHAIDERQSKRCRRSCQTQAQHHK